MENKLGELLKIIKKSNSIVFFGGAGVSTESGIPDFRSDTGIYRYKPEYMLSHEFLERNPEEFFNFYKQRMIHTDVSPNIVHTTLSKLEQAGKLKGIVTQNIDGLHQKANSKNVLELHGSILKNYCKKCKKRYNIKEFLREKKGVTYCNHCGGIVRPAVTLYGENLNSKIISKAIKAISTADVLIVGGTSLVVQPAASLINCYTKDKLVLINKEKTSYDQRANYLFNKALGTIFKEINKIFQ